MAMMKHPKNIERRTFLQDRFEILIKKQKAGQATFNELTELDELVNRHAAFREIVLEEMQGFDKPSDDMILNEITSPQVAKQSQSIFDIVKSFIGRLFILKSSNLQSFHNFRKVCISF
jgi:hypothetical protein